MLSSKSKGTKAIRTMVQKRAPRHTSTALRVVTREAEPMLRHFEYEVLGG